MHRVVSECDNYITFVASAGGKGHEQKWSIAPSARTQEGGWAVQRCTGKCKNRVKGAVCRESRVPGVLNEVRQTEEGPKELSASKRCKSQPSIGNPG